MKRIIKSKKLISFIVVLIVLVSISTTSFAIGNHDLMRMKSGIAAAITAINIALNSAIMPIQEMIDYVGDPMDYQYTYAEAWNDRPQIQIWDDYVNIDGVEYTDIWISNEAAEKFRTNAFDFRSAYNIASNSDGTFASGVGDIMGAPAFDVGGTIRTQEYSIPTYGTATVGDTLIQTELFSGYNVGRCTYNGVTNDANCYYSPIHSVYFEKSDNYGRAQARFVTSETSVPTYQSFANAVHMYPFDFDYVAGTIPADNPLPADTGMMIRIPSYDPNGNKYLEPFLHDNPEFDTGEPLTVDVNLDPDIMTKLDDLFDIIAPIIPVINNNYGDVTFVENHEQPAPVIDNLLPDTYKQEILQPITQNFQQTQETIQNMGDTIVENIPKIDEICNNIDTAPYHDLDTGLDHLPTVFLPFITDLRSALGIWHYVTEWISQISTTFAFVTGCLVGTSIMTPIYAAIAGFMCIKVYRRMTG